ncbi:DUF1385 domain-containing protein [Candidatus Woesearchaeota archaeon]|nr:DUF1385 domain-containing protein [Candidatus Woesearchaeota archaeon]
MESKKINVGGQAVIEGVLIRGPSKYVIAVRKKAKIMSKKGKIRKKSAIYKLPFIRGFVNLAEMMVLGTKALMWSADQQLEKDEKIGKKEMAFSFIFAILFGAGIFIALPYIVTNLIGFYEETKPLLFNLIDGVIRISFFLLYIVAISLMKDVKIMFQYHGAEHKAIHCYEKGKKLSVANVKKFTTLHPRCGTAFIIIVLVVAILIFSVLTPVILMIFPKLLSIHAFPRRLILILIRFSLFPLIAGISYEFLKFSAKYESKPIMKIFIWPGLLMQKITTQEPNNRQIEVAIYSLKKLLAIENKTHENL